MTLEAEGLLRLLAAGETSPAQLSAVVKVAASEARELLSVAEVTCTPRTPSRTKFTCAFVFDLLLEHALGVLAWAERSREKLAAWPALEVGQRRSRRSSAYERSADASRRPRRFKATKEGRHDRPWA